MKTMCPPVYHHNSSVATHVYIYIYIYIDIRYINNGEEKRYNHCIYCSQINIFTEKFPLMKKLNSYFRIPCKSSSETADLRTQTQTLNHK